MRLLFVVCALQSLLFMCKLRLLLGKRKRLSIIGTFVLRLRLAPLSLSNLSSGEFSGPSGFDGVSLCRGVVLVSIEAFS